MMAVVLFGLFFVMVFLNIPVAVALGVSSLAGLTMGGFPLTTLTDTMYSAIGKFTLLAIPFFILAGVIMEYAGISRRLVQFAKVCVGHRKGGLISVVVIVSCFFAAISGSGPATVAALGSILIPAMVESGYDEGMSTALMSASGAIGIVIPPSIAFVIYASISGSSVGKLFAGGIDSWYSDGSFLCSSSYDLLQKEQYQTAAESIESRDQGSIQGCYLGALDSGYHSGWYLWRNLYRYRICRRGNCVWPVCGNCSLQRNQDPGSVETVRGCGSILRNRIVYCGLCQCLCMDPDHQPYCNRYVICIDGSEQ